MQLSIPTWRMESQMNLLSNQNEPWKLVAN